MEIRKNLPEAAVAAVPAEDLAEINALAKKEMKAEDLYTFSVKLCDNEIDRDGERFDEETLRELAPLFVGKSGIFDHCWSAREQTARIYRTELCHEPDKSTAAGDGYCYLKGKAYMLRNEKNRALIEEIEAGIKKEVSVGCSVREAVCSICGKEAGRCEHVCGKTYQGKLCHTLLRGAQDAYEWSFVAVPAQRNAGIMKAFSAGNLEVFLHRQGSEHHLAELQTLQEEAAAGRRYMKALRREVLRLACTAEKELDGKVLAGALEKLEEAELLELQRIYRKRASDFLASEPQLKYDMQTNKESDGSAFLI